MIGRQSSLKVPADAGRREQRWRVAAVCLVLAAITFAVFGQTAGFGFVNYDDDKYVYENPVVAKGLTLKGFVWALTDDKFDHWHPLTWLTHMADCQAFGLWAGGHHLTNVALHAAAVIFLFLALREMTGSLWRSAFVAAVFAIHPLRAESVAWIAERKDVLSGFFFMLTLWAYARYVGRPSGWRYAAVAVAYALGLLCKNTLVTLPFVLLLLDWWPLQRRMALFGGLVKEKIPLFLLSAGSCVVTVLAPQKVIGPDRIPFLERLGNAVLSYGVYLWQMVFPAGLAVPYLYPPNGQPFWKVGAAFVLLAAISMGVLACWKKRPYLLVGWLWYLGMLVPAIGIVQISYHSHADRFTYLPGVGLVLAVTWLVAEWRVSRVALGSLMAGLLALFMFCAWQQTGYWQSSETLWSHTLACTTDNDVAQNNLGFDLMQRGRMNAAITCFQQALQIRPDDADARNNLGYAFLQIGKADKAIPCFQRALQIRPDYAEARNNLGIALFRQGKTDDAAACFQQALQIKPDYTEALNNLGNTFMQKGRLDEAIPCFQRALQIKPGFAEAHDNLGNALLQIGKADEAITECQQALQIKPDDAEARVNLGNALFRKGRLDDAIAQYQKALQINSALAKARINLNAVLRQKSSKPAIPSPAQTH
jgi:protein O-mannosyl-transferase